MPYVRRTDGYDAAHAAHQFNALGGLNEVYRDRSVPADQPTEIIFWTTDDDIVDGDEVLGDLGDTALPTTDEDLELNAEAFGQLAGPILVKSYENHFIPNRKFRRDRMVAAMEQCDAEVDAALGALGIQNVKSSQADEVRKVIVSDSRRMAHANLGLRRDQFTEKIEVDEVELAALKDDVAAGRNTVFERLIRTGRAGETFVDAAAAKLGLTIGRQREMPLVPSAAARDHSPMPEVNVEEPEIPGRGRPSEGGVLLPQ